MARPKSLVEKIKVVLYVTKDIDVMIEDCRTRLYNIGGREYTRTKTKQEVYIEFIERGIASLQEPDKKSSD